MRHSRHTFATEMLRSGVSLPALMKLLGHSTPKMTLLYAEITQTDLQREFHLARSNPRHLVPPPKLSVPPSGPQADLPGVLHSLQAAQHVVEMFRRNLLRTSQSGTEAFAFPASIDVSTSCPSRLSSSTAGSAMFSLE